MRSLSEYQAEVFRRGEEKVRRRRRRQKTAVVCTVLALCIGVIWAVAWVSRGLSGPVLLENPGITGEQVQNETEASTRFAGIVTVTGKTLSLSHADPEAVEKILDVMTELTAVASEPLQDFGHGAQDFGTVTESNTGATWTLQITRPDGVTEEYRLRKKYLYDMVTKEYYALSKWQWEKLSEALGLPSA